MLESFVHTFKLINQGPSYTNKEKVIKFFFPNSTMTSIKPPKLSNETCDVKILKSTDVDVSIPTEGNPVSCFNHQCLVFTCTIPRYWKKSEEKAFDLEIDFDPKQVKEVEETTFSIYSFVAIDNQGN